MKLPIIFILIALVLSGCSTGKVIAQDEYTLDQGKIELYFCPTEDCEQVLVSFLESAQTSIHCAFYDIGLESVQQTVLKKQKEIEVLIVTDDDYLKKFNHPFVKADSYGLMHNKFCVVDGQRVSTGSMNPTENDAHKNNNNLLLIDSEVIAQNYEDEFQELWNGNFKKGSNVQHPLIRLGDVKIQTYFCPEDHCAEHLRAELKKAEKSIHFMTFSFTHPLIIDLLLAKNKEGVVVKGIVEAQRKNMQYEAYQELVDNGISVSLDKNKYLLHHKVFIVDESTVITGSFNPSKNGDENNDENLIVIHSPSIAQMFLEEFGRLTLS